MGKMSETRKRFVVEPKTPYRYTKHQLLLMQEFQRRHRRVTSEKEIHVDDPDGIVEGYVADLMVFWDGDPYPVFLDGPHHFRSTTQQKKDAKANRLIVAAGWPDPIRVVVEEYTYSDRSVGLMADEILSEIEERAER